MALVDLLQTVYLTNESNLLLDLLYQNLSQKAFSTRCWLLVPSEHIKTKVFEYFASEKTTTIPVEVFTLDRFLRHVQKYFSSSPSTVPQVLDLSLQLQQLFEEKQIELPLMNQVGHTLGSQKLKNEWITQYCDALSKEVLHAYFYQKPSGSDLEKIIALLKKNQVLPNLEDLIPDLNMEGIELHLYGFSHLPKTVIDLLFQLSSTVQYYYFLTPTMHHFTSIDMPLLQQGLYSLKSMVSLFESRCVDIHFHGVAPNYFVEHPEYRSLLNDDITSYPKTPSVLDYVKMDLFTLRPSSVIDIPNDDSFAVVAAHSKLREVEIVIDRILGMLKKDPQLHAKDISVYCSNIEEYRPYILAALQDPAVPFEGVVVSSYVDSHTLRDGVLQLLSLGRSRWTFFDLMALFENPFFMERHSVDQLQLKQLGSWIESLSWGFNKQHRSTLFSLDGLHYEQLPQGHTLQSLFADLIDDGCKGLFSASLEDIGFWMNVSQSLFEDLEPIFLDEKKTLKDWAEYLFVLIDKYLIDSDTDKSVVLQKQILEIINVKEDRPVCFTTLFLHLQRSLSSVQDSLRAGKDAIGFLPMDLDLLYPSKGVVLLGIAESSFEDGNPLQDSLRNQGVQDWLKEKEQFFINAMLVATDFFWVGYPCQSAGKPQMPWSYLNQWLWFLDHRFTMNGSDATAYLLHHYPEYSFSKDNYTSATPSNLSYWKKIQDPKKRSFFQKHNPSSLRIESLNQISSFLTDPLSLFYQKSLYLPKENTKSLDKLSALDAHQVVIDTLHKERQPNLAQLRSFPEGMLGEIASHKLEQRIDQIQENLNNQKVHCVELSLGLNKPLIDQDQLTLPALNSPFGLLEGTYPLATKRELFLLGSDPKRGLMRIYPFYLAMCMHVEDPQIVMMEHRSKKVSAQLGQEDLDLLYEYIGSNYNQPSFLYPANFKAIMEDDLPKAWQQIDQLSYVSIREEDYDFFVSWYRDNQPQIAKVFARYYESVSNYF